MSFLLKPAEICTAAKEALAFHVTAAQYVYADVETPDSAAAEVSIGLGAALASVIVAMSALR